MKLVVTNKNKGKNILRINRLFEFVLYLVCYSLTFLLLESLFSSFVISYDHKWVIAGISVCVIYLLNKIVKPLLVTLTIPITGITFGLFYFVINTVILKMTDWIMGSKLDFTDIWILFFIAILFSGINFLIEEIIIKPILRKAKRNE